MHAAGLMMMVKGFLARNCRSFSPAAGVSLIGGRSAGDDPEPAMAPDVSGASRLRESGLGGLGLWRFGVEVRLGVELLDQFVDLNRALQRLSEEVGGAHQGCALRVCMCRAAPLPHLSFPGFLSGTGSPGRTYAMHACACASA